MRARKLQIPVILLTGYRSESIDLEALDAGATDFLDKGNLTARHLKRAIRYALQQFEYECNLERLVYERTQQLEQANAHLKEAVIRRNDFLATLAHELRNPLAPIRNSIAILHRTPTSPHASELALGILERQVQHMVRLIDDLVDMTRLSRGIIRIANEPTELALSIQHAVDAEMSHIEKRKQTLINDCQLKNVTVNGDHVRLTQVFSNLLSNASKFTPEQGQIKLFSSLDEVNNGVSVSVQDTGIGIAPDRLPTIFEWTSNRPAIDHRTSDGLGMGLALVSVLSNFIKARYSLIARGPTAAARSVFGYHASVDDELSLVPLNSTCGLKRTR